jgi:iron complex outermembrane receptor protein
LQQQLTRNLYAFADLQYRMVNYKINGFRRNPELRPDAQFNFLNPKAGLSYLKAHNYRSESKAYASFAVANKEPNRDDFEASPAQAPLHESLYNTELGYQFRDIRFEAGANLYYMLYKNQLIPTGKINDVGTATRTNVPNSYRMGIELMAAARPVHWLQLAANATISRNKINTFTEYIDNYDTGEQMEYTYEQTDIAFSPRVIAAGSATLEPLAGRLKDQQFFVDLMAKHVGRQYLDNTTNIDRSINPYSLCDIRLRYTLQSVVAREIGISLALNNIFNKYYEANGYTFSYQYGGRMTTENYYFPQAGFNFLLALNIRF